MLGEAFHDAIGRPAGSGLIWVAYGPCGNDGFTPAEPYGICYALVARPIMTPNFGQPLRQRTGKGGRGSVEQTPTLGS